MGQLIKEIKKDFIIVQNEIVQDPSLSLKAKGVYSLLLSLPDNWEFSVKALTKLARDGKDSIASALRELEDACLLKREMRMADCTGKIEGCDYVIFDKPYTPFLPFTDLPLTENPSMVSQNCNSLQNNELFEQCEDEFSNSAEREKRVEKEREKESFIKEREIEKSTQKREEEPINNELFMEKKKSFSPPSLQEIRDYVKSEGLNANADHFYSHYSDPDRNWRLANGKKMVNWRLAIRTWARNSAYAFSAPTKKTELDRKAEDGKRRLQGEEEAYEGPIFAIEDDGFPF